MTSSNFGEYVGKKQLQQCEQTNGPADLAPRYRVVDTIVDIKKPAQSKPTQPATSADGTPEPSQSAIYAVVHGYDTVQPVSRTICITLILFLFCKCNVIEMMILNYITFCRLKLVSSVPTAARMPAPALPVDSMPEFIRAPSVSW